MPKQETFFVEQSGSRQVTVLKSYDQDYAREVFRDMAGEAHKHLWNALKPEEVYELANLPKLDDPDDINGDAEAFLWDELLEQAREDGNLLSYFIVNETVGSQTENLYVSPDWPSAESFAKSRLATVTST